MQHASPANDPLAQDETAVWQNGFNLQALNNYQEKCRIYEASLDQQAQKERNHFIIVIPVADRPRHLADCLHSIWQLCQHYHYGGYSEGRFTKVSVLIADDSKQDDALQAHQELSQQYTQKGVETFYFGPEEQQQTLSSLGTEQAQLLTPILGNTPAHAFYHKGASITRNLAYIKLQELATKYHKPLFWFLDSDQELRINLPDGDDEQRPYAVNYFYHLDRLFQQQAISVLTGKVVGDPPVSPSVMAGNFLQDVIAFLQQIKKLDDDSPCAFHTYTQQNCADAAYHDMADLFGFKGEQPAHIYHCPLPTPHNNANCLHDFCSKLSRFFDGEHPTRRSYYQHQKLEETLQPARTVYSGNYLLRPQGLRYFIPFAPLRLRMAGPVLGRIIKSEIGEQFVSANLPLLHRRTVEAVGQSEFRPGIERSADSVDLSGEFERQFFGDIMLFATERLSTSDSPIETWDHETIAQHLLAVEQEMLQRYRDKQQQIMKLIDELDELTRSRSDWPADTAQLLHRFIDNMRHNFSDSSDGYQAIYNATYRAERRQELCDALLSYHDDRRHWQNLLDGRNTQS